MLAHRNGTVAALAASFGGWIIGDKSIPVFGLGTISHSSANQIALVDHFNWVSLADSSTAGVLLCNPSIAVRLSTHATKWVHDNPRLAFARTAELFDDKQPSKTTNGYVGSPHIAPTAIVAAGVKISAGVSLGEGAEILEGAVIHYGARIGCGTRISSNAVVHSGCTIGDNCRVEAGVIVGGPGSSYERHRERWLRIPSLGSVRIGDNVDIGPNSTVNSGLYSDTTIESGAKIGNLVHIAHDVQIGKNALIVGCTAIAGSAKIGANCLIAGQVGIAEHCHIADNAQVTARTLVAENITQPGGYSGHLPFEPTARWRRIASLIRRMPELHSRLKKLEARLN